MAPENSRTKSQKNLYEYPRATLDPRGGGGQS